MVRVANLHRTATLAIVANVRRIAQICRAANMRRICQICRAYKMRSFERRCAATKRRAFLLGISRAINLALPKTCDMLVNWSFVVAFK